MKKLSLIVAVALGTLVTCSLALAQEAGKDAAKKKGFSVDQRLERMTTQLNLTDEQKPKVKAVLEANNKKMQELRGETDQQVRREKMQGMMEESKKKMKEILTAEQFKKYEEMGQGMRGGKKDGGEKKSKKKTE